MDGEQPCTPKSTGDSQLLQKKPDQQRLDDVQRQVRHVIAGQVFAPEPPLDPERGIRHWPIIRRLGGEPELIQAAGRSYDRVLRQQQIVVQEFAAADGGQVDRSSQQDQDADARPRPRGHRRNARRCGYRCRLVREIVLLASGHWETLGNCYRHRSLKPSDCKISLTSSENPHHIVGR